MVALCLGGLITTVVPPSTAAGEAKGTVGSINMTFRSVQLGKAVLSLPSHWTNHAVDVPVWLHLHGAPALVEQNFASFGAPGVLVNVTLPGLSKVYADHFADETVFAQLLADVEATLRRESAAKLWRIGRVTVTSFSAGFGGVRQILRHPASFGRIDALVMADSIYCGYAGDVGRREVDADLMAGFLRFARLAAEGGKRLVISHSQQVPEGYASTTETADYLLRALNLTRHDVPATSWPAGLTQLTRAASGQFEVLGFAGASPEDHMRHLRGIAALMSRALVQPK